MEADVSNPATWWRLMLRAIVGLQAGNTTAGKAYIAFVAEHRGKAAGERARAEVKRYAAHPTFADGARGGGAKQLLERLS